MVQTTQQIEQGGFARTRVTHDDGKIPLVYIQINIAYGMVLFRACAVCFAQVMCTNNRCFAQENHSPRRYTFYFRGGMLRKSYQIMNKVLQLWRVLSRSADRTGRLYLVLLY
ncbi:hypothetical protein D3C76_1452770 [compost metagenome]